MKKNFNGVNDLLESIDIKNTNVTVQTSLMPFSHHFGTVGLNNCKTLQDVINTTVPLNFKDCVLVTTLNNKVVYPDERENTLLTENDIIGLNWIPAGGGGGGKNTLGIIATIALVVVAVAFAPAAIGAMSGWGAIGSAAGAIGVTSTALATGLYWGAASMVMTLAQTALQSTPKQSSKAVTQSDSPTSFIEGASNRMSPYGIIPVNLGTNRMFPNLAATTYTETNGNKQYARQLFTYGYGKLQITDRKFGETPVGGFEEVEFDDRLNADLNEGTKLYTQSIHQDSSSLKLTSDIGYVIRTTQRDVDEAIIDVTFSSLCFIVDYGKYQGMKLSETVQFDVYYSVTGENNWINAGRWSVSGATTAQLRVSKRIVFPSRNQYDIRINRLTGPTQTSDSYLTAIKSIGYSSPVKFADISGTALRVKATDQLNGQVDSYNAVVTTLVKRYNPSTHEWEVDKPSSNPADLFRYVLQSPAFAKRLGDNQIDLEKLAEWWEYCDSLKLEYNRVIDYDTSVDDVINDICAAGVATPTKVNNIYSVIIDNERPLVKGLVTPRNSWDYKGSIAYPELPHALRIEFRNKDKGYETDERIVYNDGYDENNAELYERLQFSSCTNADLAYWYGRRYFATAKLQPETHTFKMDFECMTFNRGDRISLVNDVILVGVGQGRIMNFIYDNSDNPTQVLGFRIDDELNIPNANKLGVRIRDNSGKHEGSQYYLLKQVTGVTNRFEFDTHLAVADAPAVDSLCAFVEDGKELDLIITGIKMDKNQAATITAIDYAPARFTPLDEIPDWQSQVTIPADYYRPLPPKLGGTIQSDESVMMRNSDGSLISVMIIPLTNENEDTVVPIISYRLAGTTEWTGASALKRDAEQVILTGLEDGLNYDFQIRYQRQTGKQLLSEPLYLTNVKFVGGSTPPSDVENFRVSIVNGMALFEWTPIPDVDVSYYVIRFTSELEDVSWQSAQILYDRITANTVNGILQKGTYLIKAYDLSGQESVNATVIKNTDQGAYINVVEELNQHPDFLGIKDGVRLSERTGCLRMNGDVTQGVYYFFPEPFDLGEIYDCALATKIKARIVTRRFIRDYNSIRRIPRIRQIGLTTFVRDINVIRDVSDIRTFQGTEWNVRLEYNLSRDGENWTGWQRFTPAQQIFRYAMFRVIMSCDEYMFTPEIVELSVVIDMPDRYESGEDVKITDANQGKYVKYRYAFRNNPSVNVTVQNGAVDDRIVFEDENGDDSKNNKGFTVKVYNATLDSYVTRTFDYISAGYGKVYEE